jgi:hypothetical protein
VLEVYYFVAFRVARRDILVGGVKCLEEYTACVCRKKILLPIICTVLRSTTTFRSTKDRIHDGSPIVLQYYIIQNDQKVSVHLMITIQKVTINVQSVPRQSPDIY